MLNPSKTTWKNVWKNKGNRSASLSSNNTNDLTLADLIAIDGFDSKAGFIREESWREYVERIQNRLKVPAQGAILEVGCGAGAFLLPFSAEEIVAIFGIDYTTELIDIARAAMPAGTFKTAEAKSIPFEDNIFDAVVSNGVFYYFPDYQYAEQSILEMVRVLKPGGTAAILDISDLNLKQKAEAIRASEMGVEEYNRLYASIGLSHLYFDRKWFESLSIEHDLELLIEDQTIAGYKNGKYRFNVYLKK